MDELLLRWLTPRTLVLGILLAGSVWTVRRFHDQPRLWLGTIKSPSAAVGVSTEPEIMQAKELRESKNVQKRYVRLAVLLEQARIDGFDVSGLQAKASAALSLNRSGYRRFALTALSEVELAIPRKRTQYIPMEPAHSEIEIPPDIKPSAAKRKKRRAR